MNGGYNLLAFPHGGHLIRDKEEGWTPERTMGPLSCSVCGENCRGTMSKRLMKMNKDGSIYKMKASLE